MSERLHERRFPEDYSIMELRAIATQALASDDYGRRLLREQLLAEELDAQR
jgi:hypothetical protein